MKKHKPILLFRNFDRNSITIPLIKRCTGCAAAFNNKTGHRWTILLFIFIYLVLFFYSCNTSEIPTKEEHYGSLELNAPLPVDPNVIEGKLENGLTYIIRENSEPKDRVELRLIVKAGSVLESDEEQGLAHYLEHMAFNGTEHFAKQEIISYLESIGMRFGPDLNAYTSFDETVYELKVPTDNPEVLDNALLILKDWAGYIQFDEDEIEKERGIIIEEWRQNQGVYNRIWEQQIPFLYYDSRYALRMPIGKVENIESFSRDDFIRFYNNWYRPDLMAVIAVGDFDPEWMKERIVSLFSDLTNPEDAPERIYYNVPEHPETLVSIVTDKEATDTKIELIKKMDIVPNETVADYRQSIVESIFYNILNNRLRELSFNPDSAFLDAYSGRSNLCLVKYISVIGAYAKENQVVESLQTLLIELEKVIRYGFTETELERTKNDFLNWINQHYRERDKTDSATLTFEYIRHFLYQESIPGIEFETILFNTYIPAITLEEVNRIADNWLLEGNRVILVSMPEGDNNVVPIEDELLALFDLVRNMEIAPYVDEAVDRPLLDNAPEPGKIIEESFIPELDVTEWILSNGIKILLKPTDFKNDQILLKAISPGGYSLVLDEDFIPAKTVEDIIILSGIGFFTQTQLEKKLSGKNVYVAPWIDELFEGLKGSSSPEDMEILFQLIYLYFTQPRVDPLAFKTYKNQLEESIKYRLASPTTVFWDTVTEVMYQDHLRKKPFTEETLNELDLEKSFSIYKDRFADASDFTFIIVGSFSLDSIRPFIEQYIASLPALYRQEEYKDNHIDAPDSIVERIVKKGMEDLSQFEIIFYGNLSWTLENIFTIDAMSQILEIRLREIVREALGQTYHVSVYFHALHFPDEEYYIFIGLGCAPEEVEYLTETIFQIIENFQEEGPTEKELNNIKEILKKERETDLRDNDFWVNILQSYYIHNYGLTRILDYYDLIDSLTPELIHEYAATYLNTDRYARIILYPEDWE